METSASMSSSTGRPQNVRSRLGLFTSYALALVAIVLVSGFFYKSLSASVENETRLLVVNTANYRKAGVHVGVVVPYRRDPRENMASTDQRFNWSHLVGTNADEAKKKIQEEHPHLQVHILSQDAMMTMDYNIRRVRIFKDGNQNVARVPKLG